MVVNASFARLLLLCGREGRGLALSCGDVGGCVGSICSSSFSAPVELDESDELPFIVLIAPILAP